MKAAPLILSLPLLFLSGLLATATKERLRASQQELRDSLDPPPLFLPEAKHVKLVTLGYDTVASKLLWFYTINYFGKQFHQNHEMKWFGEMCDLVTELDPNATHVYDFCGTLLSWVGKDPQTSEVILARAVQHRPNYWRYYYLRAFNRWYFLEDRERALEDLTLAAKLPDAPPLVASLAARMMNAGSDPELSVRFLEEVLSQEKNEAARAALEDRLKRARLSRDLSLLSRARDLHRERFQSDITLPEDLLHAGILPRLPRDPFGGQYLYDRESAVFRSSTGERGLEYREHTAESGLFRKEFGSEPSTNSGSHHQPNKSTP